MRTLTIPSMVTIVVKAAGGTRGEEGPRDERLFSSPKRQFGNRPTWEWALDF